MNGPVVQPGHRTDLAPGPASHEGRGSSRASIGLLTPRQVAAARALLVRQATVREAGPRHLRMVGGSMAPLLAPGDVVVWEPRRTPRLGDVVVLLPRGTSSPIPIVHRLIGRRGPNWVQAGDHSIWAYPRIAPSTAVLGVAIQVSGSGCSWRLDSGPLFWLGRGMCAPGTRWLSWCVLYLWRAFRPRKDDSVVT